MNQTVSLRIILEKPPTGVAFGLQKGSGNQYETVQTQSSNSEDLQFECTVQVKEEKDEAPNLLGPFVQGPKNGRFIYIGIGTHAGQLGSIWSRRLKIPLQGITWEMIAQTLANPDLILETRVPGTGKDGTPNCATVKPFGGWYVTSLDLAKE